MTTPVNYAGPTGLRFASVQLFGQLDCPGRNRSAAYRLACDPAGACTTIVLPPNGPPHPGLGVVSRSQQVVEADGTILSNDKHASVIVASRDCPILIAENQHTHCVGVAHAGRWSLSYGIVEALMSSITRRGEPRHIRCFITGGIRHQCFHHEEKPDLVDPLRRRHLRGPEPVITDPERLSLDLFAAIRNDLRRFGVLRSHITDDGLCTWSHPSLGSKRASDAGVPGKENANWVLVRRR